MFSWQALLFLDCIDSYLQKELSLEQFTRYFHWMNNSAVLPQPQFENEIIRLRIVSNIGKPCIRKSRNQSIKSVGMSLPSWCFLLFQMTKNVEWLLVIWYYINFQETVAKKSRSTKKQYDNSEEKFVECIKWCSVWCSLLDQIVLTSTTEMKIKHSNLISSRYFKSLKFRIFKKQ